MENLLENQEVSGVLRIEQAVSGITGASDQELELASFNNVQSMSDSIVPENPYLQDSLTRKAVQCQEDIAGLSPDSLSSNTSFNEVFHAILQVVNHHSRLKNTSEETRQEVAQTIVCKVFIVFKNNQYEAKSKFSTWLHTVISNTAITHLKMESGKPLTNIDIQVLPDKTDLEESVMDKISIEEKIAGLAPKLTDREKTVINYLGRGYKYYEIALALGISYGAVRVIMTRIRNKAKNDPL